MAKTAPAPQNIKKNTSLGRGAWLSRGNCPSSWSSIISLAGITVHEGCVWCLLVQRQLLERNSRRRVALIGAGPSLRSTEALASGSRMAGVHSSLVAHLSPLLSSSYPLDWVGKREWRMELKRYGEEEMFMCSHLSSLQQFLFCSIPFLFQPRE